MKPLYFSDQQKQLYGVHHSPSNESKRGIILCPPIGEEYIRAHRAITLIANKLANNGFHVLRFDYFATGDSAGETGMGSFEQWIMDIHMAIAKLTELSNISHVSLLGFRFGATLAAFASHTKVIDKLVLVEPIKDGTSYLNELTQLNSTLVKQHEEKIKHTKNKIILLEDERLGFLFPENLRHSISGAQLGDSKLSANKTYIISSGSKTEFETTYKQLDELPTEIEYSFFDTEDSWSSLESLKQAQIPLEISQKILDAFSEK